MASAVAGLGEEAAWTLPDGLARGIHVLVGDGRRAAARGGFETWMALWLDVVAAAAVVGAYGHFLGFHDSAARTVKV